MKKLDQKKALALSLVFALLTAYVWNVSTARRVSGAEAREPEARYVPVVVAATDISARAIIRPDMVRVVDMREDAMPPGAVSSVIEVYDKVALRSIPSGGTVSRTAVAEKGPALGMAYNLPPNKRAVAVPLDPVSGVAGFLKPGDHVDVLATYTGDGMDTTRTVLQDIELLAIGSRPINTAQYQGADAPAVGGGQDSNQATVDAPTATLAVWPDQAQALVLAAARAKIHLALRSPDDLAPTPLAPTNTTKVFGLTPRPAPAAAAPPPAPAPMMVRETAPPAPAPVPAPPPAPVAAPAPPVAAERETHAIAVVKGTEHSQVVVPN